MPVYRRGQNYVLLCVFGKRFVVNNHFPFNRVAQPAWYVLVVAVVLVPLGQQEEAKLACIRCCFFLAIIYSTITHRATCHYIVRHGRA
jgi:hypothetical protein